jgi:predicted amidohydrolase
MYVTVLNYDTEGNQSDGVAKRKMRIEAALQAANGLVAGKMKAEDNGRRVWNIFVAPEYSFANPVSHANHVPGDVRHLSEGAKVSIEAWLKELSAKHPRTLIFPGSIAWKKALVRSLATYLHNKEATHGTINKAALTSRFQAKGQTRQQKSAAILNAHSNQFLGGQLNVAVSGNMEEFQDYLQDTSGTWWYETIDPSGVSYNGKLWTDDPDLAIKILKHAAPTNHKKLNELGGGKVSHMARNTSLIYLNGKKQAKYHKAQDYHEVLDGKGDTVYVPGNSLPTFTVDRLTYGVEICLDHAYASLNARLPAGQVPDVVVLMSAKVKFNSANLPNSGAMVIHACSEKSWNLVGRGGVADAGCTRETPATTTEYTLHSFDL